MQSVPYEESRSPRFRMPNQDDSKKDRRRQASCLETRRNVPISSLAQGIVQEVLERLLLHRSRGFVLLSSD